MDRNRRVLSFTPGSILAFVRWTSNDFGTVLSRIDILRAAIPGQRYSTVPWITARAVRVCCGYPAGRRSNGFCN